MICFSVDVSRFLNRLEELCGCSSFGKWKCFSWLTWFVLYPATVLLDLFIVYLEWRFLLSYVGLLAGLLLL